MSRNRFLWLTKCLLYCLLGMFIAGRLSDLLNPIVWWVLHKNGTTFLQRPSFIAAYYLPLIVTYGFLLGLIPLHRLRELLASVFGKFRVRSDAHTETDINPPMLWAWVPVGTILAFRVLTFSVRADHSVLGSMPFSESRYEHFLAPLDPNSVSNLSVWIFDRFILTGPTLFLIAYTFGVWVRHQYPNRPPVSEQSQRETN